MDLKRWKNIKYFLNMEKHQQISNVIRGKVKYSGIENTTNSIIGEIVNFYSSLLKIIYKILDLWIRNKYKIKSLCCICNLCGNKNVFFSTKKLTKMKFTKPAVKKVWISLYWTIRKYMHACWLIIDVEDKQLFDFNYILLNNIFCNNDYLFKWKVDVTAECRIC